MSSPPPVNGSPRRGLPKWFKATIVTLLVAANLAALFLVWALITGRNVLAEADTDDEVVEELSAPTGDSLIFLVVGSDSREGLDDLSNFGDFPGQRGDVIMLVRVDRSGQTRMLSIPRDLWVPIPGHGENRINAAYAFGGPRLMVQTIRENLGIPVHHYVEIGFVGFMDMVDELGGIELTFPHPARDASSGLNVEAGTQRVDGATALAYARSRKYEEHQNGSWVGVDDNDIGRTQRQQQVVKAILSELKSPASVTDAGNVAGAMARHMTIDARLADSSLARLAWDFRGLLTGDIDGVTLPVDVATRGGASVVVAREPDASQVIAEFLAGAATVEAPPRVQVLNGNGVAGAAASMRDRLQGEGFEVIAIGDADRSDYGDTVIRARDHADGERIRAALGFGVVEVADVDDQYDVVVIVGADAT